MMITCRMHAAARPRHGVHGMMCMARAVGHESTPSQHQHAGSREQMRTAWVLIMLCMHAPLCLVSRQRFTAHALGHCAGWAVALGAAARARARQAAVLARDACWSMPALTLPLCQKTDCADAGCITPMQPMCSPCQPQCDRLPPCRCRARSGARGRCCRAGPAGLPVARA